MKKKQQGLFIAQLGVFIAIAAIAAAYATAAYMNKLRNDNQDRNAVMVGEALKSIDDAVKTYTTHFFTQIQRNQAVSKNGHQVSNSKKPTVADLVKMGMLNEYYTSGIVKYAGIDVGFDIEITMQASGCVVPTCNLTSLVRTTRPLYTKTGSTIIDVRRASIAAKTASASHAGVSIPTANGGNPSIFVGKDGLTVAQNAGAVEGLIAVRNGYESEGLYEFDRRDGSLPRTGKLRMNDDTGNKHSIEGAKLVSSEYVHLGGGHLPGTSCAGFEPGTITQEKDANGNPTGMLLSCQSGVWKKNGGDSDLVQKPISEYVGKTTWPAMWTNGVLKLCSSLTCEFGTSYKQYTILHSPSSGYYLASRSRVVDLGYPDRDGFFHPRDNGWSAWSGDPGVYTYADTPQPTPAGLVFVVSGGGNINDTPNMVTVPWGE